MIPDKHVISAYGARLDRKGELIPVSGVGEEEKTTERHIQLFELRVSAETQIVCNDALQRPDKAETIFTFDSVGLQQATSQVIWKWDRKSAFGKLNC